MNTWLERRFNLKHHGTSLRTEFLAGLTTFVTMAYIIIVQPNLMGDAGMPAGPVMVSTLLISALFSIIMGFYTNRPFALAPAMGGNAFFAYTIVAGGLATWQTALGMVFISGTIFFLLTLFGVREAIANMLPKNIKLAIGAAVGIFIAGLGLKNAGIVVVNEAGNSLTLASFHNPSVLLAVFGLVVIFGLMARGVKGAVLYGIVLTTLIGIPLGLAKLPEALFQLPPNPAPILFQVDWLSALKLSFIPLVFTFFTGDFFSTMGTVLGVGGKAGLLDENGDLPDIKKPFMVDSVATMVGSMAGLTTVTTYIESASGVEAGGRTGLTAISTGFFFLIGLLLTPIFLIIPNEATAPALIVIGLTMLSSLKGIDFERTDESMVAFLTVLVTGFTFSIANGIVFGVLAYVIIKIVMGKIREIPVGLFILCIPLIYYLWLIGA
ncbi:NCS2 family permease [Desmospora activa]|uniref:AGZA family xanthine/uracil permease-like MFS transporter n=1 Tax=Desmospora activa DSM 45169 TaxID=1121389 RepID=A0A2T4ZDT7_9BACL|nr:NCS2 family permease [Desmospora activa]PTM60055.1 AGZA family xanthine/uracil permease-like MFS transporter [Desmospora activa DSM 45169]